MNKILKKLSMALTIGAVVMGAASCSDPDDIIDSVQYNRLFSPAELEAKVQNTTGVKISWTSLSVAESYAIELYADDEAMAFSGTPLTYTPTADEISTVTTNGTTTYSYNIAGLEGETIYSVRVKAVGSPNESKWSATTFETGTEQVFYTVPTSDITKTSVTLSWPAGIEVTTITVQKKGETLITHAVTTAEKAAGRATIDGLNVESTYTFYLWNGEKQRGKIEVATLPNFTPVTDAADLQSVIDAAEPGEVIMLTENKVYDFTDAKALGKDEAVKSIKIEKDIVLNTNNHATIKGIYFQIYGGANVEFANITLDGTGGSGDQAFNYKEEGNYGKLYIHDAEIKNFTKGFFYINVAAVIDDITIDNCLIHDIECSGGDMFDSRSGGYNTFNLKNSTIYNSAAKRDFIRMDDASSKVTAKPVITVDHCTLYNVGNGGANYRLLYVRFAGNVINWTNNLVVGTNNKRGFANQATTSVPTFKNNFYFNTENLVSLASGNEEKITFFDNEGVVLAADPFKGAADADFTVTSESVKDKEAGDPRWLK